MLWSLSWLSCWLSFPRLWNRSQLTYVSTRKSQILAALNLRDVEKTEVEKTYDEVVVADEIIDKDGNVVKDGTSKDADGFAVEDKTSRTATSRCMYVR